MTTLYKPVLIETVEQAEALPVGTVGLPNPADDCRAPYLKTEDGWISGWYPDWRRDREQDVEPDAGMVGETALVPVKAREETNLASYYPSAFGKRTQRRLVRLVTPWEPVP